jgi:virginiamycin B lyase
MSKRLFGLLAVAVLISIAGTVPAPAQRGGAPPVNLPDGNGKEVVQSLCSTCHNLNFITTGWGYDKQGWDEIIASMVPIPAETRDVVTTYLGTHFSEKTRPATVVVPGDVSVNIREWMAPSLGSRPHDPWIASDGSVWWTGMWANVLGRVDPRTGAIKEFPLKTPRSGPHGLTEDKDGNIWFTGNQAGLVGKLDPKTGEVTEYRMPDPAARDPHTPLFDPQGNLWFSLQNAQMVGKLNPQTGDIKLVKMPGQWNPYGVVMTSKGVPVVCMFRTNVISSFDPVTMERKDYTLPNADSRPRRIAITADDMIWYGDYSRGYLGRLNLATGEVKEWPSPSGRQSQPYGITATPDGVIWYNESAIRPNTLVRFDPKTEKFQSWVIPSGGGIVRNMAVDKSGNIAMACSGVNRVAYVEVGGRQSGN